MAISVKLNVFEGPLDLLLHLIDKNRLISMIFLLWRSQTSIWNICIPWRRKILAL